MNLATRPIKFGVPALIILAFVAGLAFWAGGAGGPGGTAGGVGDRAFVRGAVSVVHQDAGGNILSEYYNPNTVTDGLKLAAADRVGIGVDGTISTGDIFDWIQACTADLSGGTCVLVDLSNDVSKDQPIDGTGVTGATGEYVAAVTFTCLKSGGCAAIEEIQLVEGDGTDPAEGTPEVSPEVGAWQNVAVTLAINDTLTVTWTIDIG